MFNSDADEVDSNQEMGNAEAEVSEESMDKSNELKIEAVGLFGEGNFQACVDKYTEAIKLNGSAAALFAKRGQAYLKLEKPNACIRDCTRALEMNPDSAMAYKFRGRAHRYGRIYVGRKKFVVGVEE
jgi:suppressor of tumorigenicity protein 13